MRSPASDDYRLGELNQSNPWSASLPRCDAFGEIDMERLFHFRCAESQFRRVIPSWKKPLRIVATVFDAHILGRP